jgi:nucleotide-binding universal stress UspA family protein
MARSLEAPDMPVIQDRVTVSVETIMLATDFSPAAEKAALFAKALARRFASTVEIAHIFDPSTVDSYEETILSLPVDERRQNSQDRLEALQHDFLDAGIKALSVCSEGHRPAHDILELARKDSINLIVTGTKSSRGVGRLLLGSTAEAILRAATCPVLTVGPKAQVPPDGVLAFKSILFATDFSAQASKAAIFALSFAEDSGSHLYYCHVIAAYPGSQRERPMVDAMFEAALKKMIPDVSYEWCSPESVVEHGEAVKGILAVAERVHADLIVVGPRKASFLLSHLEHGVTHDLLAEASCPVLTVC